MPHIGSSSIWLANSLTIIFEIRRIHVKCTLSAKTVQHAPLITDPRSSDVIDEKKKTNYTYVKPIAVCPSFFEFLRAVAGHWAANLDTRVTLFIYFRICYMQRNGY